MVVRYSDREDKISLNKMAYYLTETGMRNLGGEIQALEKTVRSLESKIHETAESCGDLYHDNPSLNRLHQEIGMFKNKLIEKYKVIREGRIITYPKTVDSVCLGSKVTIEKNNGQFAYSIMGYGEADLDNNQIIYDSPLAQAIIGAKTGQLVDFRINGNSSKIKILKVEPLNGKS